MRFLDKEFKTSFSQLNVDQAEDTDAREPAWRELDRLEVLWTHVDGEKECWSSFRDLYSFC